MPIPQTSAKIAVPRVIRHAHCDLNLSGTRATISESIGIAIVILSKVSQRETSSTDLKLTAKAMGTKSNTVPTAAIATASATRSCNFSDLIDVM